MGSENNMVAVPDLLTGLNELAEDLERIGWRKDKAVVRQAMEALTRLAQPDAQQGATSPASGEGVEEYIFHDTHFETAPLAAATQPAVPQEACGRPFSEWHEEHGDVLWWKLPISEAPYCGSPLDLGRSMKVVVQVGVEEHDLPITMTGGWPFDEDDECDLWWTPLPKPTFYRAALTGAGENGEQGA